jgi:hypothetical protein
VAPLPASGRRRDQELILKTNLKTVFKIRVPEVCQPVKRFLIGRSLAIEPVQRSTLVITIRLSLAGPLPALLPVPP